MGTRLTSAFLLGLAALLLVRCGGEPAAPRSTPKPNEIQKARLAAPAFNADSAYAYIAQRYDIDFVTLHDLDPEGEPSPDAIAEVLERVDEDGIKAIYVEEYSAEGALDSLIAQTVSDDLPDGLAVLTLNTMEMAPTDQTEDYLSLMNENLENLKTGLGC